MYESKKPDENGIVHFTDEENETWSILMKRQSKILDGYACDEFIDGLARLDMPTEYVPQCYEISERLMAATGWSVEPVPQIIPVGRFFKLLANRQFPAATFIRTREDIDYLKEPDIFHEYFGHCPLITNQAYADFLECYGKTALNAPKELLRYLGRLFWFTIEFGLLRTEKGLRIYGGGILSSYSETPYALDSQIPQRVNFDIEHAMSTHYRYDEIQKKYFILSRLEDLFRIINIDLIAMARKIAVVETTPSELVVC